MRQNLERLVLRFNALSDREKLMSTASAILIAWAVWDKLLYQSLNTQLDSLNAEIVALDNNLSSQHIVSDQLKRMDHISPEQQRLDHLQTSVDRLKQQLGAGEKKFVPAQLMAEALRDMLQQHGNLKLIKLETLPIAPFGSEHQQPAWVYRHTLALTVQGDFFSTVKYLQALEALPWRVHWDSIDYRVEHYPTAETRIQVYTLSFDKDWLGV